MTPCDALRRWIDDGRAAEGAGAHLAHAAGCSRCAAALAVADALEAALRVPPAAKAPAWLLGAVMAEVNAPRRAPARARHEGWATSRGLALWTLLGLLLGGAGYAAVTLLGPLAPLPALDAGDALRSPASQTLLATTSLAVAAGLTWLSLRLTRTVELAALRVRG